MTGTRMIRTLPWVLGVCLVVASSVGANRLLNPDGQPPNGGDGGKAGAAGGSLGGVIVLGHVDSDPPPIPLGPPAVLGMSPAVTKVLVKEGDEVKPGTPLVQFDDATYRAKLRQAKGELAGAQAMLAKAQAQVQIHAIRVDGQKIAVKAAEAKLNDSSEALRIAKENEEKVKTALTPLTGNQPREQQPNLDIKKAEIEVNQLRFLAEGEKTKLRALELDPVAEDVKLAQAKIDGVQGAIAEAEAAIAACLRKADVAGVVEQIAAAPGMTFGPSSRAPLLYLIPTGPRVVRAEVVPEFASRVLGTEGKRVTVYDQYNPALSYPGTVRRASPAFLPKRSSAEALSVNGPDRVLECLIDVTDPAPAGKPPLRVGQPVRVTFQ